MDPANNLETESHATPMLEFNLSSSDSELSDVPVVFEESPAAYSTTSRRSREESVPIRKSARVAARVSGKVGSNRGIKRKHSPQGEETALDGADEVDLEPTRTVESDVEVDEDKLRDVAAMSPGRQSLVVVLRVGPVRHTESPQKDEDLTKNSPVIESGEESDGRSENGGDEADDEADDEEEDEEEGNGGIDEDEESTANNNDELEDTGEEADDEAEDEEEGNGSIDGDEETDTNKNHELEDAVELHNPELYEEEDDEEDEEDEEDEKGHEEAKEHQNTEGATESESENYESSESDEFSGLDDEERPAKRLYARIGRRLRRKQAQEEDADDPLAPLSLDDKYTRDELDDVGLGRLWMLSGQWEQHNSFACLMGLADFEKEWSNHIRSHSLLQKAAEKLEIDEQQKLVRLLSGVIMRYSSSSQRFLEAYLASSYPRIFRSRKRARK